MSVTREELLAARKPVEAVWGDPVPDADDAARKAADLAVEGCVAFYGEPTEVGRRDIDWSGKHHDHQEWRAQLNRFFPLKCLAACYRETGEERYAEAARDYIADWIRAHPACEDWRRAESDNVLNLCIRMGNSQHAGWTDTLPVFMESPAFDAAFVDAMLDSIRVQLDHLIENMASSINWRIANADCLLLNGIRLTFLHGAKRWRRRGVRVLNDAWRRQILPDGVHLERTPGYHFWMTRVMADYWRLGRAMPELGLVMEPERIRAMFDYALVCTRPNGSSIGINDNSGTRKQSRPNAVLEPRKAFCEEAGLSDELPPQRILYEHAGQAFLRDGWDEDATLVTFDATVWGGGHCHLARNSVQIHVNGRTAVCDPGIFTYEASDPFCAYGKSTRAHSTLTLDGRNQWETNPNFTRHLSSEHLDFVASEYEGGYSPGEYAWGFHHGRGLAVYGSHQRMLLRLRGGTIVVLDNLHREFVDASDPDTAVVEANWQLCDGATVAVEADARRAVCAWPEGDGLVMLFPLAAPDAEIVVHEGETDPIRGWLPGGAPDGSNRVPAPMVSAECRLGGHAFDLATVIIPFTGEAPAVSANGSMPGKHTDPRRIRIDHANGTADEIIWQHRNIFMLGEVEGVETDAGMLVLRRDASNAVVGGCAVEGTYVAPHAKKPIPEPGIIEW